MTFEEFENTLQDWLDEDRLAEVETLIPLVSEADRPQCEELLHTYQALFAGLAAVGPCRGSESPSPAATPDVSTQGPLAASSRYKFPVSSLVAALAACLAVVALVPGWFSRSVVQPEIVEVAPLETVAPSLLDAQDVLTSIDPEQQQPGRNLVYLSTYSIEPLARSVANQTDTAFRSLEHVSRSLNPIDKQLEAYRDAAPLLETLTDGFLPGSRSLSNAFSLLQETADGSAPHTTPAVQEPTSTTAPEPSAVS